MNIQLWPDKKQRSLNDSDFAVLITVLLVFFCLFVGLVAALLILPREVECVAEFSDSTGTKHEWITKCKNPLHYSSIKSKA